MLSQKICLHSQGVSWLYPRFLLWSGCCNQGLHPLHIDSSLFNSLQSLLSFAVAQFANTSFISFLFGVEGYIIQHKSIIQYHLMALHCGVWTSVQQWILYSIKQFVPPIPCIAHCSNLPAEGSFKVSMVLSIFSPVLGSWLGSPA